MTLLERAPVFEDHFFLAKKKEGYDGFYCAMLNELKKPFYFKCKQINIERCDVSTLFGGQGNPHSATLIYRQSCKMKVGHLRRGGSEYTVNIAAVKKKQANKRTRVLVCD